MFVGHFAVGLGAKRIAPQVSLGTLVLAAMLADLLWCVFMLAGLEHVTFGPGLGAAARTVPVRSLITFSLAIAWAYWVNRLRLVRLWRPGERTAQG